MLRINAAALREHTAEIRRAPTLAQQACFAVAEKPTTRSRPRERELGYLPRVLATVVVVVAAVGYVVLVKSTRIDRTSLSALVIDRTGVTALKSKPVDSAF